MLARLQEAKELAISKEGSTRSHDSDKAEIEEVYNEATSLVNSIFDNLTAGLDRDKKSSEHKARALRRYVLKAGNNFRMSGFATGDYSFGKFLETLRAETNKITTGGRESVTIDEEFD